MTLSKEKFDHILAYAKQQQNLGVHHCNILPDDMVAIMEMAAGKQERRERGKQEPLLKCSTRTCAAPPAPVVPETIPRAVFDVIYQECDGFVDCGASPQVIWNACRAAMLGSTISNSADIAIDELPQSFGNSELLNSPVVPDGWIKCSERMPAENDIVIVVDDGYFVCEAQYRDGDFYSAVRGAGEFFETTCRDVELWQPLPAAPKQESE